MWWKSLSSGVKCLKKILSCEYTIQCILLRTSRKYPYSPLQRGLEFPEEGGGGYVRPQHLKKCVRSFIWISGGVAGWGGGVLENIPSVGEVWIFSGTTRFSLRYILIIFSEGCVFIYWNFVVLNIFLDAWKERTDVHVNTCIGVGHVFPFFLVYCILFFSLLYSI